MIDFKEWLDVFNHLTHSLEKYKELLVYAY